MQAQTAGQSSCVCKHALCALLIHAHMQMHSRKVYIKPWQFKLPQVSELHLIFQHGAFQGSKIFIWQLRFFGTSHLPGRKDPFYLNRNFSSTWKAAAQESAPHTARAGKWDEVTFPGFATEKAEVKYSIQKDILTSWRSLSCVMQGQVEKSPPLVTHSPWRVRLHCAPKGSLPFLNTPT